jgi:hypothetical protein
MEASLMEVFGPWLPPLFGFGVVLLVGGLVAKQAASGPFLKGVGRGAVKVGSLMLLLAVTLYLLIVALAAAFENMISNLPGA